MTQSNAPAAADQGLKPVKRDDDVRKTVVDAYYRKLLDAPEAARRRAQAAYAITAAVAAALVTAGAFAGLAREPLSVRILGPLALVAWLVAAGLYIRAVGTPYEDPKQQEAAKGVEAFLTEVLRVSASEYTAIGERQTKALWATLVAVVMTLIVAVFALFLPSTSTFKAGSLRLDPTARAELNDICTLDVDKVIEASINTVAAPGGIVQVKLPAGTCTANTATTTSFEPDEVVYALR